MIIEFETIIDLLESSALGADTVLQFFEDFKNVQRKIKEDPSKEDKLAERLKEDSDYIIERLNTINSNLNALVKTLKLTEEYKNEKKQKSNEDE